eukprot:gb/GECG01015242.1/.p1 GENE.gb/GECG01015242.1/~~gb/GECG01015242.1/.p1  ORF type:complete len:438 (+),score=15.82 gb/GECG01015242.1/:1-1314(+)
MAPRATAKKEKQPLGKRNDISPTKEPLSNHDVEPAITTQYRVLLIFLIAATSWIAPVIGVVGKEYGGSWANWIADKQASRFPFELNAQVFVFWAGWIAFQSVLLLLSPKIDGATTPRGHIPQYRGAGIVCFFVNIFVWSLDWPLPRDWLYHNIVPLLCAAHILALGACCLLMFKGLYYPSSTDSGTSHSALMDFYWGTELHPEIGGVQIKQLINCRIGMMLWPILLLSYVAASKTLNAPLLVSVGLQLVYIFKFFLWEGGYLRSMDMQHDRAGYYTEWGCFVWVPAFYTCASLAYVHSESTAIVGPTIAAVIGILSIYANWDADMQKYNFKLHGHQAKIWGQPAAYISTDSQSSLLVSGWWGVARHVHYVFEILAAFLWCIPGVVPKDIYPCMYGIYLTILLLHRLFRDDERCQLKYGHAWDRYCQQVPYKLIPLVF